jgi:hypothetical protein
MRVWRILDDAARLVQRSLEQTFLPVAFLLGGAGIAQVVLTRAHLNPLLTIIGVAAVGLVASALAQALLIEDARRQRAGQGHESLFGLLAAVRRRVRTLVAAQLLIFAAVSVIGLICFVFAAIFVAGSTATTVLIVLALSLVPAGILLLNWSLVPSLVVIERRAPLEALHASSGLAQGRRLRLLAAYAIAGVGCWLFSLLITLTLGLVVHGTVAALIYYVTSDIAWVVVMTSVATAAFFQIAGTRHTGSISVSSDELDRWAAVAERKRGSSASFRI